MLVWLLSLLPLAIECLRFAETDSVTTEDENVEGKLTRCTVDGNIVFYKAAEDSPFAASWQYLEDDGAGVKGWVINVPEIVQIEVPEKSLADAKEGKWFSPSSYTAFNNDDIDQSGINIQQIFSGNIFLENVRIDWNTPSKVIVSIKLRDGSTTSKNQNVEIEFSKGQGRTNLQDFEYYMPIQGKMISLTVDDKNVFDGEASTILPVVCTPAFLQVGNWARGLDVNVAGFTWFWVRMSEMMQRGYFEPNSHGYSNNSDPTNAIMEGLKRWGHRTVDKLDTSAALTIRSDANTVEIAGNGTEMVFTKENIMGKVTKCMVGGKIIYEQVGGSRFPASWEYRVDTDAGVNGWVIDIPTVVQFEVNLKSLMESDTSKFENKFSVTEYTVYPDDTENMDEMSAVRYGFQGDNKIVDAVSLKWDSHNTIKMLAHVRDGQNVEIEFSRGEIAANAEHYDTLP